MVIVQNCLNYRHARFRQRSIDSTRCLVELYAHITKTKSTKLFCRLCDEVPVVKKTGAKVLSFSAKVNAWTKTHILQCGLSG